MTQENEGKFNIMHNSQVTYEKRSKLSVHKQIVPVHIIFSSQVKHHPFSRTSHCGKLWSLTLSRLYFFTPFLYPFLPSSFLLLPLDTFPHHFLHSRVWQQAHPGKTKYLVFSSQICCYRCRNVKCVEERQHHENVELDATFDWIHLGDCT